MNEWKDLRQSICNDVAAAAGDSAFADALKLVEAAIEQAEAMSPEYAQMRREDAARRERAQRLARQVGALLGDHVWDALMDHIDGKKT